MNEIQNSFLQAIQTLTDSSIAHSKATMTVKAEITEVVSISQGIYKARYLGDSLTVYATPNLGYSVGSIVYILIPDGNFSNKKLILGNAAVVDEVSVQVGESSSADEYYDISENFFANFNGTIQLCSYKTSNGGISLNQTDRAAKEKIIEYLKYYNTFYFGATIQTALDATQKARNGKYGIKLSIPLKGLDEETSTYWKEIQIDPSNILGNPYALEVPTPQFITFSIDTTKLTYDSKREIIITYFNEAGEDSFLPDENKPADIFLTNIIFKTIETLPESIQQGYSLTIEATQGTLFTDKTEEIKTLTPTVRYNGNKITLRSDTICYWFVEDASINARSKGYVSYAGAGWRCLNDIDEEGNPASALSIDVEKNDLIKELKYKCVIIYDKNVISNTITLVNVNSSIELELTTSTGETQYSKKAEYVELKMTVVDGDELTNLSFSWSRKDKNGQIIQDGDYEVFQIIESTSTSSTVKLSTLLIDELNTISCTVIKEDKIILGTKSLTITVGEIQIPPYRLVINNGDRVYKYDSDGDSPMIANYDGPLSSIISAIKPLTYQIFRADGTEFTETDYRLCNYTWKIPKNSLIQVVEDNVGESLDYYLVSGNGGGIEGDYAAQLNYKIANKFNNNKSDNNITLEVKFNDAVLEEKTNMFFLKEGASGTNGTKYAAVITYDGYGYGQKDKDECEQKLRMYYTVADKTWYFSKNDNYIHQYGTEGIPTFDITVYEDGEVLSSNNYTVLYSMFDEKNLNPFFMILEDTSQLGLSSSTTIPPVARLTNIVQATITITKDGTESSIDSKTVLYAYYPIETSLISGNTTFSSEPLHIDNLCYLQGGFSEVVYATDGTNPQYNNASFEYKGSSATVHWNSIGHLTSREIEENALQRKYIPDSKYDDGNTKNYVRISAGYYTTIQPIVFLYNRYEMSNLNGWDGNKLYLDDAGNYILAPQVGAGIKNDDNSFTGVVMGIKKTTGSTNTDVGLFGYGEGKQTMFLNAKTGGFTFGNNQIVFTPEDEKMEFNNVVLDVSTSDDKTGVIIDPLDKNGSGYIFQIRNGGESVLEVKQNGDTTFNGIVNANKGGTIAGFEITDTYIQVKDTHIAGMGSNKYAFWAGYNAGDFKFLVEQDGTVTAQDLFVTGGEIGGITIDTKGIYSGNFGLWKNGAHTYKEKGVVMHAGGIIREAPFIIYQDGSFEATDAIIKGDVICRSLDVSEAATIAGLDIGKIGEGTNSKSMTFNGQITCNNLVANESGTIAGWTIGTVNFSFPNSVSSYSGPALYGVGVDTYGYRYYSYLTPVGVAVQTYVDANNQYVSSDSLSWYHILAALKKI